MSPGKYRAFKISPYMQERATDFKNVVDVLTATDYQDSTPTLVKNWVKDWAAYVKTGGDRPPVAPPKP